MWGIQFHVTPPDKFSPNFNAAPTQLLPVITNDNSKHVQLFRWGLVPFWAKDISIGSRMINARAETVSEKPSFRASFKSKRCLVPADGFYEWQKSSSGTKTPYRIVMKSNKPFAFAGLWDSWKHDNDEIHSFTILTTTPNSILEPIHDRMPVILPQKHYALWLDNDAPVEVLEKELKPYPSDEMVAYPVTHKVNSPSYNKPDLLEPVSL